MAKMTINVSGMSCNHCKMRVEKTVSQIPGVESVVVNLQDGKAEISGTADVNMVIANITKLGYTASPAMA